ncbi:Putative nuclease HARBI1 [Eumeta japonica]|uniref:Nuclease HARBI1 n=1 Tax=Eumeta variegata TaxID=151549 RepID=A0A4C1VPI5_EUMVA|nr:Putative nuclease HARBI1 [Eumeta japonica]
MLANDNANEVRSSPWFLPIIDAFSLSDQLFVKNFRLSKELVRQLVMEINPYINHTSRSSSIDVTTKVLIALNFFATGSYQNSIGSNVRAASSQASVSKCIGEVVNALNHPDIFNHWVKFPSNFQELDHIRADWGTRRDTRPCTALRRGALAALSAFSWKDATWRTTIKCRKVETS